MVLRDHKKIYPNIYSSLVVMAFGIGKEDVEDLLWSDQNSFDLAAG